MLTFISMRAMAWLRSYLVLLLKAAIYRASNMAHVPFYALLCISKNSLCIFPGDCLQSNSSHTATNFVISTRWMYKFEVTCLTRTSRRSSARSEGRSESLDSAGIPSMVILTFVA